jgi:hypothetical protein
LIAPQSNMTHRTLVNTRHTRVTIDRVDLMTVVTVSGRLELTIVAAIVKQLWVDDQYENPYILWDLSAADSLLDRDEVKKLADFGLRHAEKRFYGRIALVVSKLWQRQAQAYQQMLAAAPYEVEIFNDRASAAAWVSELW